jgi:UDP-glucose 4-epimerase
MTGTLVIGGAGFIGSALVRALASTEPVRVFDDLSTGHAENLTGLQVELVVGSVLDTRALAAAALGVDTVYHLACLGVRQSIHDPRKNLEVNATGTLNVLEACRGTGVKRLVYTSTSEVYGTALKVPMTESHPTLPHTVYGASKLAGEALVRAYHRTYALPTVAIRPFNAYGPRSHHEGDSGEVIPRFIVRAMNGLPPVIFGDGTNTRDFTYVDDTASALVAAANCDAAIGQTINIGSGVETSIHDLALRVLELTGADRISPEYSAVRPGDIKRLVSDASMARSLLGWQPTIGIGAGLQKLIEWHREVGTDWERALSEQVEFNWEAPAG